MKLFFVLLLIGSASQVIRLKNFSLENLAKLNLILDPKQSIRWLFAPSTKRCRSHAQYHAANIHVRAQPNVSGSEQFE